MAGVELVQTFVRLRFVVLNSLGLVDDEHRPVDAGQMLAILVHDLVVGQQNVELRLRRNSKAQLSEYLLIFSRSGQGRPRGAPCNRQPAAQRDTEVVQARWQALVERPYENRQAKTRYNQRHRQTQEAKIQSHLLR